jgi:Ca2+/Na+ antiporter
MAIALDSLLLNLDRNNFVSLLPFYWAAATTWFSIRSRKFLRFAVISDTAMLIVVYSIVRTLDIDLYRWPVVMIALFAGVVFLQALAFLFSLPREIKLRTREAIPAVLVILALILLGGALFLGPSQRRALEKGGGLLEPKLFSFDFSQFLRLDSEISVNDDLILIVKKESDYFDEHILLRRSVLSGYSRKQGFYRIEELDERTHPQRLPGRTTELPSHNAAGRTRSVNQEYFLVNFDGAAFIGMNEPVSVTPYENWDASSFRSAYKVESLVSTAGPRELSRAGRNQPGAEELGLSDAEFKTYTEYSGDERIRSLAEEITQGPDRYADKVRKIHDYLKFGEYRYSLKPGIAPDGDQLGWFLFQSKKGYCSYYAFAMTLLLRSLGIPARLAAGLFIDLSTNTFDYYPVRADMAHAWVEVPFPGQGWIEFDPTSENLAEGEEFRFSAGVDPQLFEKLMREIIENRSLLRAKEGTDAAQTPASSLAKTAAALLRKYWLAPILLIVAAMWLIIRCRYLFAFFLYRDRRKKAVQLWKHAGRLLRLAGLAPGAAESESEWAHNTDRRISGIYAMYQNAAAARFAPVFTEDDFASQRQNYLVFCAAYKQNIPVWRRLISWLLPPLALLLSPAGIA